AGGAVHRGPAPGAHPDRSAPRGPSRRQRPRARCPSCPPRRREGRRGLRRCGHRRPGARRGEDGRHRGSGDQRRSGGVSAAAVGTGGTAVPGAAPPGRHGRRGGGALSATPAVTDASGIARTLDDTRPSGWWHLPVVTTVMGLLALVAFG